MLYYSISALVNAVTSAIFCLVVIIRNPKAQLNRSFSYLALSVTVWAYGYYFWQISNSPDKALFWCRFLMAGAIFLPSTFFHLGVTILEDGKKYLKSYRLAFIFSIVFFCLNFTSLFIEGVEKRLFFSYWPIPGVIFPVFLAGFLGIVIYTLILLYGCYRTSTGIKRNQLRYIFLGTLLGALGGSTNYFLWYNIPIPPVGNILMSAYVVAIGYAIIKHRLLEVNLAFTRGAILLIVYAFIVGISLLFVVVGKPWLIELFQDRWFYPPLGLYTLLALLAPYIYLQLQSRAEQRIIQRQLQLHRSLKAASKTTIEVQSIEKLSKIIPRYLLRLYARLNNKIMHISLFLQNKDKEGYKLKSSVGSEKLTKEITIAEDSSLVKWFTTIRGILVEKGVLKEKEVEVLVYEDIDYWLNRANIASVPFKGLDKIFKQLKQIMKSLNANIILPSVYQKELLGFLILGEKTPDPYSTNDIDTFSILANDSAMALKAAQLFEDLKVAQARLIQSEKLNLLGQLASSMAHEINNPLAIISGNVQLLLMDEKDVKKKKLLKKINDQTERGYTIINRLLNFSRLPKEDIKDIAINDMIDETLELVNHKILHGNIQLERNYNPVEIIKGNPTQIQEVFLNLFVNAIQAMPQGGRLKLFTKQLDGMVQVEVEDTGKGIVEKDAENIFDPFYSKDKEEGTGLGLFVADQIMKLHQGSVSVKSKVGEGTIFVLKFPIEV